jgi:hypothetical protein
MKLKWSAGQTDLPPVATIASFDFMVAKRPKYIPGSGPPLAPITAMPPHDKDGFIIDKVQFKKQLRYLVGYDQYPQLKVSVQPQNILDWVSRHALEEWESERYDAEERRQEEEELPAILAKEERRRKRLEAMSRAAQGIDGRKLKRKRPAEDYTPRKIGRSTRLGRVGRPSRAASRRGPSAKYEPEEDLIYTSPRLSQRSQVSQQPSLSTPSRNFGSTDMMDVESNDEGSIDTDTAINMQLGLTDTGPPSRSTSESVDMLGDQTRSTSSSNTAHSSNGEGRSIALSKPNWQRSILPGQGAVAGTSSREALKIYEDLERMTKSTASPHLASTQSPLKQNPSLSSYYGYKPPNTTLSVPAQNPYSRSQTASRKPESGSGQEDQESDEDESEYELHQILDEQMRRENGKQVLYYLINWVGDYDNTWEPAENVSQDAIADFKERRRRQRMSMRLNDSRDSEVESGRTPGRRRNGKNGNGKGKSREQARGQVIDDDDGSDD